MGLDMVNYEARAREAVRTFWHGLEHDRPTVPDADRPYPDEREDQVDEHMRGFVDLVAAIVRANGLEDAQIHFEGIQQTLPGYFRPTVQWSVLVLYKDRLVAAVGLASHVGPFANDRFDSLAERTVAAAQDFRIAYAKGAFGPRSRPFTGCLVLVEDESGSSAPASDTSRHFPVPPEFEEASYQQRYHQLCQRLVRERLYSAACVITSLRTALGSGQYADFGDLTGLRSFVAASAGHVAAEAARA